LNYDSHKDALYCVKINKTIFTNLAVISTP